MQGADMSPGFLDRRVGHWRRVMNWLVMVSGGSAVAAFAMMVASNMLRGPRA